MGASRLPSVWRLLLQKVGTDCPGDFLWGLFVDAKVVELWKFPCFRSREDHSQPLHRQIDPGASAFAPKHQQDISRNGAVVFIAAV